MVSLGYEFWQKWLAMLVGTKAGDGSHPWHWLAGMSSEINFVMFCTLSKAQCQLVKTGDGEQHVL